jgi:hypothetical protein
MVILMVSASIWRWVKFLEVFRSLIDGLIEVWKRFCMFLIFCENGEKWVLLSCDLGRVSLL